MEYTRTCRYCGKHFETNDGRQHYCSEECRYKSDYKRYGEYIKKYRDEHPEYRKRQTKKLAEYQKRKRRERYDVLAKEILLKDWTAEELAEFLHDRVRIKKEK